MTADPLRVAIAAAAAAEYPDDPPFHPHVRYPEYDGPLAPSPNHVYEAVRHAFELYGLDRENAGTPQWNPLRGLIKPGETVLLKPNFVHHRHPRDPEGWKYTITHGSVIRAVADYVVKALEGRGEIVVADAPQTDASFARICELTALHEIAQLYVDRGVAFGITDLRQEEWVAQDEVIVERRRIGGDPRGCVAFDLGANSQFVTHRGAGSYYGADYDEQVVNHHHSGGRHEYLIAGTAIKCDVIFSLPKLKTHKKAGVTVSMKNLVGVNGDKNWLPHHTEGVPATGGDERPAASVRQRVERKAVLVLRRLALRLPKVGTFALRFARKGGKHVFGDTESVIRSGNWWGNDTVWRMVLDLNQLVDYGNADGTLREPRHENRKRHYVLVDGIVAGEGRGPGNPDPKPAGIVLFGIEPARVDATSAYVMGFDPDCIPVIRNAEKTFYPVASGSWRETQLVSDRPQWNGRLEQIPVDATMNFKPHFGWTNRIELRREKRA